jgi:hypothetical protein
MAKLSTGSLESWLGRNHQAAAIESWMVTATPITVNPADVRDSGSPFDVDRHVARRGLDPARRVHGRTQNALVLAGGRLVGIGMGGLLRPAPKEVILDVAADGIAVEWFDNSSAGNAFRNWIIDLGDGRFYASATGIRILGKRTQMADQADEFAAALGERAREIDPEAAG